MTIALRLTLARRRATLSHRRPSSTAADRALTPTDLLQAYHQRLAARTLQPDPDQLRALYRLRPLHRAITAYAPHPRLLSLFDQAYLAPGTDYSSHPAYQPDPEILSLTPKQRRHALVKVLTADAHPADQHAPLGFLLTGPPGTGKSLLMDLFFETLPTSQKIRRHYHHFLLELYSLIHTRLESHRISTPSQSSIDLPIGSNLPYKQDLARNKALSEGWRSVFAGGVDPKDPILNGPEFVLAQVARDLLVNKGHIIAFDELQMVDIAGAGLLSRVLEWYWRLGGVILATSNRVPEHMYDEGVQKSIVLPFLNRLKLKSPTITLDSNRDWRRQEEEEEDLVPSSEKTIKRSTWHVNFGSDQWNQYVKTIVPDPVQKTYLNVYGRRVEIRRANLDSRSVVMSYKELCEEPLGPADYLSLSSTFQTIVIEDLPIFTSQMKNEARRFITFIDAAYECHVQLHVNASAEIEDLFFPADSNQPDKDTKTQETNPIDQESISEIIQDLISSPRPNISSTYSPPSITTINKENSVEKYDRLAIFTGLDEQYAFQRATSRLHELTRFKGPGKTWSPMKNILENLWNHRPKPSTISSSSIVSDEKNDIVDNDNDSGKRKLPWISPNHIWGIASWGKGAGRWGKGVEVFDKKKT